MEKHKFSIVTICYNAAKELPLTMESVLKQDYSDFEYIIQEGASTDNSEEIILSYKEKFLKKGISFIYCKGKDKGIYDAMNLAVLSASGEYVNFMNAGDCFYNKEVLSSVNKFLNDNIPAADGQNAAGHLKEKNPAIIYGDCAEYEYGRFYLFPKCPDKIEEVMPFSHQSVFAKRDFLCEHPFKLTYRYSADYDFLLTAHDLGVTFADCGSIICITTKDGVSSINYHDMLMESADILKNHNKYHHSDAELARIEKSLKLKQFVLDRFPDFIKKFIRGVQIKSRGQSFDAQIPEWYKKRL